MDVFISHVAPERLIACALKALLKLAFGEGLHVFVSSDDDSIRTGHRAFDTIIDGLKKAAVFVVLLSEESVERRWINFEAGFAYARRSLGKKALEMFPLAIRGMKPNVGQPISELQVRSLANKKVLQELITNISNLTAKTPDPVDLAAFINQIGEIEREIQREDVHLVPIQTVDQQTRDVRDVLVFDLFNPRDECLQIEKVWAAVPEVFLHPKHPMERQWFSNVHETKLKFEANAYRTRECVPMIPFMTSDRQEGIAPVPVYFPPEPSGVQLPEPVFFLREDLSETISQCYVRCCVKAKGHSGTRLKYKLSDVATDLDR